MNNNYWRLSYPFRFLYVSALYCVLQVYDSIIILQPIFIFSVSTLQNRTGLYWLVDYFLDYPFLFLIQFFLDL